MRVMSANDQNKQAGFTLVEVLVIAPIIILVLGTLVGAIIALTGSTLLTQGRNSSSASMQSTLVDIERDIKASAAFLPTTGTLPSPQGSDDGTAAFTTSSQDAIILKVPLVSANPLNDDRILVNYANRPYTCDSGTSNVNELSYATAIYFVSDGSLWRRMILPDWTLTSGTDQVCISPWRQNTCAPGVSGTRCQAKDVKLVDDVGDEDFAVTYYTTEGGSTQASGTDIAYARSVRVSITSRPTYAGESLELTSELRFALP